MSNTTFTYDSTNNKLTANAFKREGCTFLGWDTNQQGTNVVYNNSATITENLATTQGDIINLYAVWKGNTYKITYDYNGGTAPTTSNPTEYKTSDSDITISNEPTKTGYTFTGWTSTGGITISNATKPAKIPTGSIGDITLTAHWTPITYTVTFNANGGTGSVDPATHTYDVTENIPTEGFTKE